MEREIARILAGYEGIATAWLFGSVARGEAGDHSDLDLAILPTACAEVDSDTLLRLANELEPFAPSGRVDLVILGEQGPVFLHRVLSEGHLVLDRDPQRRVAFESRVYVEYLDWKPTHDIAMRSTFKGLAERFSVP